MPTEPIPSSRRFSRGLTLLVATPLALAGLLVIAVTTAHAAAPTERDNGTPTMALHIDRLPANAVEAQQLYRRVDRAALEVCGGGGDSLVEFNRAVRASDCWHAAMRRAFAQINSPRLPIALADNRAP